MQLLFSLTSFSFFSNVVFASMFRGNEPSGQAPKTVPCPEKQMACEKLALACQSWPKLPSWLLVEEEI